MRARYARLLATRYRAVLDEQHDVDLIYLYQFIYPRIMRAVQLGQTSVILQYEIKDAVEKVLVADGFTARRTGSITTLDWSMS